MDGWPAFDGRRRWRTHGAWIAPSGRRRRHAYELRIAASWSQRHLLGGDPCDCKPYDERRNQDTSNRYNFHCKSPSSPAYT